jgi:glycosyltransferase involved in cell wall biosynthesis
MRPGDFEKMVAGTIGVIQMLPELNAGGVERGTLELSRFLVQTGQRSLVISQGGTMVAQLKSEGAGHLRLPYIGEKSPRCLLHLWTLRRLFRQRGFNIVHMRSRLPAWVGYLAWKSLPVNHRPRLVTTFHGFYSVNAYSAIMTKGERVIAISKVIADHIRRCYHIPASRISLIYRGVDAESFHPSKVSPERIARLKKKWGIEAQIPLVMLPGRVTAWKGHDLFIEALARIQEMPWRAVCVGSFDSHSAFYKKISHMISESALSNRIQFTGHETDMPAAYSVADLVVSAATDEPEAFGRISIEAQAMARPIIASAHGGSLETVVDRQTGWLFKPGDADELSKILRTALLRPNLGRQYADNGFRRVHQYFTTRQMCQSTLSLYRQLLSQKTVEIGDRLF